MSKKQFGDHMRRYWAGYRAAKTTAEACGIEAARKEYAFGLTGMSRAYCDGWRRYLRDHG